MSIKQSTATGKSELDEQKFVFHFKWGMKNRLTSLLYPLPFGEGMSASLLSFSSTKLTEGRTATGAHGGVSGTGVMRAHEEDARGWWSEVQALS